MNNDKKEFVTAPTKDFLKIRKICSYAYNRSYGFAEENFSKIMDIIEEIEKKYEQTY